MIKRLAWPKSGHLLALAMAAGLLLAACGSSTTSSTGKSSVASVTLAQSIVTPLDAGVYVAIQNGYFTKEKINLSLTTLQSGASTTEAIASGSVDFVASGAFDVGAATAHGIKLIALDDLGGVTTEFCVSKSFAAAKGLNASSGVTQVMTSLKGATLGLTGINGAPDLILSYLLSKYGHLNPTKDVHLVALGSVPGELTALKLNQIDGFLQSPPGCEQAAAAGTGVLLLRPAQVPGLTKIPLGVVYSSKAYVNSHSAVTTRVATAVAEGENFARTHTAATVTILQKYFPTVPAATLQSEFVNVVQPYMPKNAAFTTQDWAGVSQVLLTGGSITKPLSTKEGLLWSNKYVQIK